MRLFVYGELCKSPVLMATLGRIPPAAPALLRGFRKARNGETGYYCAVPQSGGTIVGLVLDELGGDDLDLLDRFENVAGGEYQRVEVEVESLGADGPERAFVYVKPGAP